MLSKKPSPWFGKSTRSQSCARLLSSAGSQRTAAEKTHALAAERSCVDGPHAIPEDLLVPARAAERHAVLAAGCGRIRHSST
jgi:hypothetical protein